MRGFLCGRDWALLCALSSFALNVQGAERDGQLLDGAEWKVLG